MSTALTTLAVLLAIGVGAWCALRIAREEAAALYGIALLSRGTVLEFDEGENR
jgi:hypothetical protein